MSSGTDEITTGDVRRYLIEAVRNYGSNDGDNLYRYKMQAKADPTYRTGNGELVTDIVAQLERRAEIARRALKMAELL